MDHFRAATSILRARLAHTNRINIKVLDIDELEIIPSMDHLEGQIVCTFSKSINAQPVLLVLGRNGQDNNVTHLFAFYINTRYHIIQPMDRRRLMRKLPKETRPGIDVKLGIVNIQTMINSSCYLSLLVQAAEFLLDMDLMNSFVAEKQVTRATFSSLVCFNPTISTPTCKSNLMDTEALAILGLMQSRYGLTFVDLDYNNPPSLVSSSADVLRIMYLGHIIYGVYHRFARTLMLVMIHPGMFRCQEDADDLLKGIRSWYVRGHLNYIGTTRFYGDLTTTCNSRDALRSVLAASLIPLVVVKQCDLDAICPILDHQQVTFDVLSSLDSTEYHSQADAGTSRQSDEEESDIDVCHVSELSEVETIPLDIDELTCEPVASNGSSQTSSQQTIIMSLSEINDALASNQDVSQPFPRVHAVSPRDDINNDILTDRLFFLKELDLIARAFKLPIKRAQPCSESNIQDKIVTIGVEERLFLIPILLRGHVILMIIDHEDNRIGLLTADKSLQKDQTVVSWAQKLLSDSGSHMTSYVTKQLNLSCHYHEGFPLIHLLLGFYCLAQAFKTANALPIQLIYHEKRFRGYCHSICHQLQVVNADYNIRNGLVKDNGFLVRGAYRSTPSMVKFERSTVSTNLCPFCTKRLKPRDLKSHINMKHAGQARCKRDRRRILEDSNPPD